MLLHRLTSLILKVLCRDHEPRSVRNNSNLKDTIPQAEISIVSETLAHQKHNVKFFRSPVLHGSKTIFRRCKNRLSTQKVYQFCTIESHAELLR